MYFDFYDDRPDYLAYNRDLARLEGVLHLIVAISVAFFLDIVGVILLVMVSSASASDAAKRAALANPGRTTEPTRFVFMAPRVDRRSPTAPPRAEASDQNRMAASRDRSEAPTNPLPYSRGNSFERMEQPGTPPRQAPPKQVQADADGQAQQLGRNGQNGQDGATLAALSGPPAAAPRNSVPGTPGAPGALAAAIANPMHYAPANVFDNPGGQGGQIGPFQFDSKGVEFGPWLRRFVAQIRRNWFIPYAAMAFKGHVVVTFTVHKDGSITELAVPGPSSVDAFNGAAYGALVQSNPTYPLPPEYPSDRCTFTVTFFYNEVPPYR